MRTLKAILTLLLASGVAFAGEVGGVVLPDSIQAGGQQLALNGAGVLYNGTAKGTVRGGLAFKQAVFGIWLGKRPVDDGLKAGMLGGH